MDGKQFKYVRKGELLCISNEIHGRDFNVVVDSVHKRGTQLAIRINNYSEPIYVYPWEYEHNYGLWTIKTIG